ncbi:hypothetical protein [Embleya sp. NBC_00896]|uniref:hypothetical protein n=1 Tax=Embleya sp. NBC_00896 TaxID=2975961 RepID=UPI0038635F02|nr:hypothetical protein OG928_32195 [Embleya sp. NBC_00896]
MILPVLDGLDEMDATDPGPNGTPPGSPGLGGGGGPDRTPRARRALEALNAYARGRERAAVVLTCRSDPYVGLGTWAKDAARVEIAPVTPVQARDFVLARVDDRTRWRHVLESFDLNPSGSVARGLSTPWRLTMAVTVHEQRDLGGVAYRHDPRNLLSPALVRDEDMRDHLNGLYMRTAADYPAPGPGYTPEQVHTWLGVLADYLETNAAGRVEAGHDLSGTDLVLTELWPRRRTRALQWLLSIAPRFVAQIVGALALTATVDWLETAQTLGLVCVLAWLLTRNPWPAPWRIDLRRLGMSRIGPETVRRLALFPLIGSAVWLGALTEDNTDVPTTLTMACWGAFGGIALALTVGLGTRDTSGINEPSHLVRADSIAGTAMGFTTGIGLGLLTIDKARVTVDEVPGYLLKTGLIFLITIGPLIAATSTRYLAFIVWCARGNPQLPWRLGRFCDWATDAGLLRIAGTADQFRHRELTTVNALDFPPPNALPPLARALLRDDEQGVGRRREGRVDRPGATASAPRRLFAPLGPLRRRMDQRIA